MTNELEKQFFNTFGIEPIEFKSCDVGTFCPYPEKECGTDTCPYYRTYKVDYPAISDSILLELICFNNSHYVTLEDLICPKNIKTIKESVLMKYIKRNKEFVDNGYSGFGLDKVRTLFEEGQ